MSAHSVSAPSHSPYHEAHHLAAPFGTDWFGRKAEAFARVFGTPAFLIAQTVVVAGWIAVNAVGVAFSWDPYPFILLNLAFSTQAAYAAPLILLAQTRQADRDKALSVADAKHRDALAGRALKRQDAADLHTEQLRMLLQANTRLTEESRAIAEELETLTRAIHEAVGAGQPA